MEKKYSDEQLTFIREQAMIYQCACPAQVSETIGNIRMLHQMQLNCMDSNETDKAVHECIRINAEKSHAEFEECLTTILRLEGWDMVNLKMPDSLIKNLL